MNWNDLRYLLAVQRSRTLAGAARRLGVDGTTVARRLDGLQATLGVPLFQRQGDGTLELTAQGEAVAHQAGIIEHHASLIDSALGVASDPFAGTVRLTSVPIVVNRILMPGLPALLARHPALQVELMPDSRDYSLTRREADLALRLSRPKTGGTQVKARRIADLDYATYVSTAVPARDAPALKWISYDEAMAHLPQARWIAKATRGRPGAVSHLRVRDGESALEAILAGLGKSLIPVAVGERDNRLTRIGDNGDLPLLSRELWLLGHADLLGRDYVKAVTGWIEELFS